MKPLTMTNKSIGSQTILDSADNDKKRISPTTAKVVQDAFSHPLEPHKKKYINRKIPIPDTKVPKLDPII